MFSPDRDEKPMQVPSGLTRGEKGRINSNLLHWCHGSCGASELEKTRARMEGAVVVKRSTAT